MTVHEPAAGDGRVAGDEGARHPLAFLGAQAVVVLAVEQPVVVVVLAVVVLVKT